MIPKDSVDFRGIEPLNQRRGLSLPALKSEASRSPETPISSEDLNRRVGRCHPVSALFYAKEIGVSENISI